MKLANRIKGVLGGVEKVQNCRTGDRGKNESCRGENRERRPLRLDFWRNAGWRRHGVRIADDTNDGRRENSRLRRWPASLKSPTTSPGPKARSPRWPRHGPHRRRENR